MVRSRLTIYHITLFLVNPKMSPHKTPLWIIYPYSNGENTSFHRLRLLPAANDERMLVPELRLSDVPDVSRSVERVPSIRRQMPGMQENKKTLLRVANDSSGNSVRSSAAPSTHHGGIVDVERDCACRGMVAAGKFFFLRVDCKTLSKSVGPRLVVPRVGRRADVSAVCCHAIAVPVCLF